MNCRIEFLVGDSQRFSPNLDYLATLLVALAPEDVRGQIVVHTNASGAKMEFVGSGEWRGQGFESPLIPRWMFCDAAFQDLVAMRARTFIDCVDHTLPEHEEPEANGRWDVHAEWYR